MDELTDPALLAMFRVESTREKAFGMILKQHQRTIYYYVRRMVLNHDDADDITQTTFINAWKHLDNFRGESRISTWLHTIAYRESLGFLAREKKVGKVPMDLVEHQLGRSLQSDELYTGDEIQRQLQTAMALLPEKQKAVFIMKYFEEKKYDEIAEITGTSVGALKASFHHAVHKIETFLTKN